MGSSRAHTFFEDPDVQPGQAPREPTSSSDLGATEDFSSSFMELDVSVAYEQALQSQGKDETHAMLLVLMKKMLLSAYPKHPRLLRRSYLIPKRR